MKRLILTGTLSHIVVGQLMHDSLSDCHEIINRDFSECEREEWSNCRNPRRKTEWIGARTCLKQLIIEGHPELQFREVAIQKNERGRPRAFHLTSGNPLVGDCSLSHAGPWSVAAWTERERQRIGVDVEHASPRLIRAAGAFVSPEDQAAHEREQTKQLAIWWSLKEAASKALGSGLGAGLAEIRCQEVSKGLHEVSHATGVTMTGWHTWCEDYVIAVCAFETAG